MKLTLAQIQEATGAEVIRQNRTEFEAYGIDSRTIAKNALFFALKGENTDGHLFVESAVHNGAGGAVVEREIALPDSPLTVLRVRESMKALQDLAASVRRTQPGEFIGLTGSAGKTSTKEFTAAILSQKYGVYKSEGNLNSLTGLPLALLSMIPEACNVFELGMNHPGEIAQLATMLRPDIGMLLNVNPVHLGQFASVEAIADEKFSIFSGLPSDGVAIINADDPLILKRTPYLKLRSFSFGFSDRADLRITDFEELGVKGTRGILQWKSKQIPFRTRLCGTGNAQNIAAAALAGLLLDVSESQVAAGIEALKPYRQRGELWESNGISVYDDSYNSNPAALRIAMEIVATSKGFRRKIVALGDMLELGPRELEFHAEAGAQVAQSTADVLIAAGERSKSMAEGARRAGMTDVFWTPDSLEAGELAANMVREGDLVLVKGSRGMRMEKVVEAIRNRTAKGVQGG
ncbi:MAG TPA: UDP-N-acetylmuramoyl-tripeptide--D-alanyl-D-alanine ligase [Acidobacteriota bacterium]|nr:UDP-N-acetylmuramoyl-tripeptide--D-alanyl-D-alanine ligase [Acidobacteriota bacterium]